jgi:putative hydrolase of the HAD superfamily
MTTFDLIALDADDTLWHNERLYVAAQARLADLLSTYHEREWVQSRLYETEIANLAHFGYGIKAFALSMIETAVTLTEGRISGRDIQSLVDLAKEMLQAPVELLEHVAETLPRLAQTYPLMIITKGDLLDQERKFLRSGLEPYLNLLEVVSEKDPATYEKLLRKHGVEAGRFLMVGNSLRSDIWPVLELGGSAVYIPYQTTWSHEMAEVPPATRDGFYQLKHFGQLPELLSKLETASIPRTSPTKPG